jgi:hypothetical protein
MLKISDVQKIGAKADDFGWLFRNIYRTALALKSYAANAKYLRQKMGQCAVRFNRIINLHRDKA